MLKKLKMRIIACKIEWHWLFITPGRKKGSHLIDGLLAQEKPLNTPELIALNRRLNRRFTKVSVLMERYKDLAGFAGIV